MRSHCALYVDVGYLLAASATRVTGTSLRSGIVVSYPDLVTRLVAAAEEASGMPLLRVHWYDSGRRSGGAPDASQEAIGMLPRVKLRLGRISPQGEQKGVDLRIGLDLAAHGRNRVVDVIYLVSGDDDLCEAVEEAQNHGVQVVLMAVPDRAGKPHAVSKHLIRESDDLIVLDGSVVDDTVHVRQLQPEEAPAASWGVWGGGAGGAGSWSRCRGRVRPSGGGRGGSGGVGAADAGGAGGASPGSPGRGVGWRRAGRLGDEPADLVEHERRGGLASDRIHERGRARAHRRGMPWGDLRLVGDRERRGPSQAAVREALHPERPRPGAAARPGCPDGRL